MNLLLHGGLMFFGNADGQGKLFHGGVMVFKALDPLATVGVFGLPYLYFRRRRRD